MKKTLVAVLAALSVLAAVKYLSSPANALPVAGNPQFVEKISTPCVKLAFAVNDGGVGFNECAPGVDGGTAAPIVVGARYRVTSDQDVWLNRGAVASPYTGIFLPAGTAEEMSFSGKYDVPSAVYGVGATSAANVTLCRIQTSF